MTNRHRISLAVVACLILVIPCRGQHTVDQDKPADRLPSEIQRLRAALPSSIVAKLPILGGSADGFVFREPDISSLHSPDERLAKIAVWLLTEQIAQTWDLTANGGSGDWLNESRVGFTRNTAGFATERLIDEWDPSGDVWVPQVRTTFNLNAQNRSEETLDEGWNPDANGGLGDWEPLQRTSSTFDGEGNTLVRATEVWDDSSGEWFLFFRTTSTYDNGLLSQQVSESIDFLTGMFSFSLRTSFEYDGAGNTTRRIRESYNDLTSEWENSSTRLWTYDGQGQETEDLEQTWDDTANDWVNDYREVTTYSTNPLGMIVTAQDWEGDWVNRERGTLTATSSTEWVQTEQDWDPAANGGQGDWVNRDQELITLDSNGNFVEFVEQTWDSAAGGGAGDWVNESRGTLVYDGQGQITENLIQVWDGSQWVNESRLLQMYQEFTGTSVEESPQPRYVLEANYPNPFREETTIRFELRVSEHVTVEVFDILGRRVSTLVDGLRSAGGHAITIDGKELAGGFYVYRLQGDNVQISRTMLLVK